MRIIDLREGTDAWRQWRHGGIGSSDAPAIVGLSRYLDARELWRRKREAPTIPLDDLRLARGRALEPVARAEAGSRLGQPLVPLCVEHDGHPELRASLDGWCGRTGLAVEIKCPTAGLHAEALGGRIPRRFLPQCLHILVVTGAPAMVYASYRPEQGRSPLALVELPRPAWLCEQLQRVELAFWLSIRSGVAPPPTAQLPLAGVSMRPLR